MQELRLDFIFHHAGLTGLHGALVGARRNISRLAHCLDLRTALVETHVVQEMLKRNKLVRGTLAGPGSTAYPVDPADDPVVEIRYRTHGVKYPLPAFDQAG